MTVVLVAGPAWSQTIDRSPTDNSSSSAPAVTTTSTFPRQGNAFSRLFGTTLSDLRQMPSKENLLILGVAGLAAGMAHPSDDRVSTTFSGASSLRSTFSPGQVIGGAATQMAAAIATKVIGNAIGNPKVAALGSDLVRAQILTQVVTQGIKFSVRRTRPDGTMYSFPSGHTATSFATATVIQSHYGWKAGVPAYAFGSYVALARMAWNRHHASDVVMGAGLGIASARTVTMTVAGSKFNMGVQPQVGGASVNFTKVYK